MKGRILIVEEDQVLRETLQSDLTEEGFEVFAAGNAADAWAVYGDAKDAPIHLMILDLGLPENNGMNVLSDIRMKSPETFIMVVSDRAREEDKLEALDVGANDYLQKPFSTRELLARVRANMRTALAGESDTTFRNGPLSIDYGARHVFLNGEEVHFTNNEYKIICFLSRNVGKTLTHNAIIENVWGEGGNDGNGLRVFMAGIRRKIENTPSAQEIIRTEVGVGYRMNDLTE